MTVAMLSLQIAGVGTVAAADGGNSTTTMTPTDDLDADRALTIVNEWNPALTSPETALRIEAWLADNGGQLSETERKAVREWIAAAKEGKATATPTATPTPSDDSTGSKVKANWKKSGASVSPTVTLVRWRSTDDGTIEFVLRSSTPERIMLSDVGAMMAAAKKGEGVSELHARAVTLSAGENTVRFDAQEHQGDRYVTVADGASGIQVSTGATGGAIASLSTVSTMKAWILGAVVMFSWFLIAAAHTLRRERGGVVVAGEVR